MKHRDWFLAQLEVDLSIETIVILFMVSGYLRLLLRANISHEFPDNKNNKTEENKKQNKPCEYFMGYPASRTRLFLWSVESEMQNIP